MANFGVKFSDIENSIEVLSHYAVQLDQIKQELTSSRRNIINTGSSLYRMNCVLYNIEKSVMDKALGMRSLSEALEEISSYYRNAERKVVSANSGIAGNTDMSDSSDGKSDFFSDAWKKIRDILVSWGIIKAEKQTRTPGEAVTKAQQKEMDKYLQNEISGLLKKEQYSRKTWENASVDERKDILNRYLQEVAAIMGLEIGEINYTYSGMSNGTYNMGAYSPDMNAVYINEWVLENGGQNGVKDSYELMTTIAHEMRHAYQYAACENPDQFVVTEETIRLWQDSIDRYKSQKGFMADGMNAQEAYEAYRNQDIEVDARWFAKQN